MRCILCENLSLAHICPSCQNTFLTPSLYKRILPNNIPVLSFYKYSEIKKLLYTKHTDIGYYIYNILAENSLKKFAATFEFEESVVSIGVDDTPKSGYSHTAILNHSLKSRVIKPLYKCLRATNSISYSGKDRKFRINNPRAFQPKSFKCKNVILVDDIITTGATLTEAIECLQRADKEILFCLTLCDVSQK
jgi:competence protein ComFC